MGRQLGVGIFLTALLVGSILAARHLRPNPLAVKAAHPRSHGPVNAPIQVIEYSDFQCPACRTAQSEIFQLLGKYPSKIRLSFQHFPLEGHRWTRIAHQGAECAARQEKFWPYHDRLYHEQSSWSAAAEAPLETFLRYGREIGLDLDRFGACLGDTDVAEEIQREKGAGDDLGVRSTPSFFVNGKFVVGVQALVGEIQKRVESREKRQERREK